MEYKYHPIYKYGAFFITIYVFLRHQKLMKTDLLLLNTLVITFIIMILDIMFIHNHITIFQPLSDQHFDDTNIKIIEKELEKEERDEKKREKENRKEENKEIGHKDKDMKNKSNNKDKSKKKNKNKINDKEYNNKIELYDENIYEDLNEEYTNRNDRNVNINSGIDSSNFDEKNVVPKRLRLKTGKKKNYVYSEPTLNDFDTTLDEYNTEPEYSILAYNDM